mmetsp:Transcript_13257/g.32399  ORF Transcript_13257/g.32399 Transcript_13257/m.32399 type:complete len:619 (-) Transcript_13257:1823-3679(-)
MLSRTAKGPQARLAPSLARLLSTPADKSSDAAVNQELRDRLSPWRGTHLAPLRIKAHGLQILQNPLYNKGTAFHYGERDRLGLRGLLPPRVLDFETQKELVLKNIRSYTNPMDKYVYVENVHDNNETLYHCILSENMEELAPIVYTPTVGDACKEFGYRFNRTRGLYLSAEDRGHMHAAIANWPHIDVHVMVVTDGSRILGLGDLGAYGMGIPIGKLSLYCAAGGIAPHRVLPVMLDCGTDNEELLNDPFYIGLPHKRLKGREYFEILDEFMDAVRSRYPNAFVQFEDFSSDVAYKILNYYRDDECEKRQPVCVFNDDIQGTGAITLAGIMSGLVSMGQSAHDFPSQRFLIAGAGSAGVGVANMLLQGVMAQGLSEEEALKLFCLCDKDGLLATDENRHYTMEQRKWVRTDMKSGMSLLEVAKEFKPTILMGLSSSAGLFTEELIKVMATNNERPFIFPLSNPTRNAECTAQQAYEWTEGKAIFASGSPFAPVTLKDGRTLHTSQCNNMFIFPGIGLAASAGKLTKITDQMLYAAAVAVANSLSDEDRAQGRVYPQVKDIRSVSLQVAVAVAKRAIEDGYSRAYSKKDINELSDLLSKRMYSPYYVPLVERAARRVMA